MIAILCLLLVMLLSSGCSPWWLKPRMIKYYSDDSNYEEVDCQITNCWLSHGYWQFTANILTANHHLEDSHHGKYFFTVRSEIPVELSVDDLLTIITAGHTYYLNWYFPVVQIKKGEETVLAFEQGKQDLLAWIEDF